MILEVRDLHAYYGQSHILHGVAMDVNDGEIVSLLGRNGVGRSTTIKALMGDVVPKGSIRFKGEEIAGVLSELFRTYATDRRPGEAFGDFCLRAQPALV